MRSTRLFFLTAALTCLGAHLASAHHGKDFLVVESYELPHPGDVYFVSSVGVARLEGQTTFELEPSFLIGVWPRLALELHAHSSRQSGEALRYEATAPSIHFQFSPSDSIFPIRFGLSAEYEFAAHAKDSDRAEARLIIEGGVGRSKLALNVIGDHERGGDSNVGYAVGYRYDFKDHFACGLEGQGPITIAGHHELLVGLYGEPSERVTVKVGAGPGLGTGRTELIARFGVVLRF